MSRHEDTIAALATADGTAALAIVRASGPAAAAIAAAILGHPPAPRAAVHGDYRDLQGTLLDDVVATYFAAPRSYTGEDLFEICCHGSPFIAQKILEDLFARGCRPAGPGEFTRRAFLNGRLDLSQAEAVMDLIRARSDRALAAAQQQLRGSVARRVQDISGGVLGVLAEVEAAIDFPEEGILLPDTAGLLGRIDRALGELGRLAATARYGELLRDGIATVIAGAPNAGKSSLLNRLVGHERALVSDEPGTTRDFIEERVTLGAHSLRLIDTAGLNPAPGRLESRGIEMTRRRLAEAALVIFVADSTLPLPDGGTLPSGIQGSNTIVAWNKTDLPGSRPAPALPHPVVPVSTVTGAGLDLLAAEICRCADLQRTGATDRDVVAINARHAHALAQARAALETGRARLAEAAPAELVASELREALLHLGEIGGRLDNERMLDQLFSQFCIGK